MKNTLKTLKKVPYVYSGKANKIYPVEGSTKPLEDMKTVTFILSNKQALHIAGLLLRAVETEWETIYLTGFRFNDNKKDGTKQVTVTSPL